MASSIAKGPCAGIAQLLRGQGRHLSGAAVAAVSQNVAAVPKAVVHGFAAPDSCRTRALVASVCARVVTTLAQRVRTTLAMFQYASAAVDARLASSRPRPCLRRRGCCSRCAVVGMDALQAEAEGS